MGISSSTYIKNFTIICLTLISMYLILYILAWLLRSIIGYIEKYTKFITNMFILKIKWKYLLPFCEVNILIIPIVILIISNKYLGEFSLFVFSFYLLILSSIIIYIRKERGNTLSLLNNIFLKINKKKDNYFINRINLLFEQGLSIMILISAYMFTLVFSTKLEWPLPLQYFAFASLAIYLIIWIYFSCRFFSWKIFLCKFKINDKPIINIRRIIVYTLLAVYLVVDCYSKFNSIVTYNTSLKLDLNNLFGYIISVSFIALDRVMKSIIDDSKDFEKDKVKVVN